MSDPGPIDGSNESRHGQDDLGNPLAGSPGRSITNARLASPVPVPRQAADPVDETDDRHEFALSGSPSGGIHSTAGPSALSDALSGSQRGRSGSSLAVQPPAQSEAQSIASGHGENAAGSGTDLVARGSPRPYENFDVVRRHLAGPIYDPASDAASESMHSGQDTPAKDENGKSEPLQAPAVDEEEFSSLQLQGGDITREIYRRTEAEASTRAKPQRSKSMMIPRIDPIDENVVDYSSIHQPGGFRRHHLRRSGVSPGPSQRGVGVHGEDAAGSPENGYLTRNFYEFLSLYGHFAGEAVDEDDLDTESQADSTYDQQQAARDSRELGERAPLLKRTSTLRRRREESKKLKAGTASTILILLKSFVGTGVLFLPRAFFNGGILFSFTVMILVSFASYYCFLLLTTSRLKLRGSYADMAEMMYGSYLRSLVNTSLVISQVGFSSAYIVFTSENLRAFVLAVSKRKTDIDIKLVILMQLAVFLPLSLYRNLNKLSFIVYVADLFIVLGIVYLYYYNISTLAVDGIADVVLFNQNTWTLFIGTAVFTFEGIGLIIPIQDGMKKPQQLPSILGLVMIIITCIFVSMGALAYAAYGSKTETVILLNMDQENKFVNGVQFIYSLAILLSTPMQIFPAITIMENAIFSKSGKYDKDIKWRKNLFRFAVVMSAAAIAWIGANDLDKFVALTGSFACIPLVYIYPPLIHKRALSDSKWQGRLDWGLCGCGFVLMAYTSAITIQSWFVGPIDPNP